MSSAVKTAPRPRHTPERTCVGCGTAAAKRGLVRIVRGSDGSVQPDETGRKPGRGAYLHTDRSCWDTALKKGRLQRSLKTAIQPADLTALQSFATAFAQEEAN